MCPGPWIPACAGMTAWGGVRAAARPRWRSRTRPVGAEPSRRIAIRPGHWSVRPGGRAPTRKCADTARVLDSRFRENDGGCGVWTGARSRWRSRTRPVGAEPSRRIAIRPGYRWFARRAGLLQEMPDVPGALDSRFRGNDGLGGGVRAGARSRWRSCTRPVGAEPSRRIAIRPGHWSVRPEGRAPTRKCADTARALDSRFRGNDGVGRGLGRRTAALAEPHPPCRRRALSANWHSARVSMVRPEGRAPTGNA